MRKVITVLVSLLVLSSGAAFLIARAAEPPPPPKPAPQKALPPGAPQVPEESATIRDDRTIAPDPKQSADNNVSFPSDI
jgi:hypothetical protein